MRHFSINDQDVSFQTMKQFLDNLLQETRMEKKYCTYTIKTRRLDGVVTYDHIYEL